jgi:hypothetical protein
MAKLLAAIDETRFTEATNAILLSSGRIPWLCFSADNDDTTRMTSGFRVTSADLANTAIRLLSDHFLPIMMVDDETARFRDLVAKWRSGRNPLSSSAWNDVRNPAYQQIIGMGDKAVPLILSELRRELTDGDPDDWFVALWAITGENPVPEESRGVLEEMAKAWLDWGVRRGLSDAEGLGASIPSIRYLRRP